MSEHKRIALVTGANQGVGREVAQKLAESGVTVLVGSRDFERGKTAAAEIGSGAVAIQIDVTDTASIAAAADRIGKEYELADIDAACGDQPSHPEEAWR